MSRRRPSATLVLSDDPDQEALRQLAREEEADRQRVVARKRRRFELETSLKEKRQYAKAEADLKAAEARIAALRSRPSISPTTPVFEAHRVDSAPCSQPRARTGSVEESALLDSPFKQGAEPMVD